MRNNIIEKLETEIEELKEAAVIAEKEKAQRTKETEKSDEIRSAGIKEELEQKTK